jgi:LuxR family maltose regulon positive regulatory protein
MEARLHLLAGSPGAARLAIDAHQGIVTADLAGATAAWAAATADRPRLRKVVEDWAVADGGEAAAVWTRDLWTAVLQDREGDRRRALATLRTVVEPVEGEGAVRFLLDSGPEVSRLLKALYHHAPTPFLRRLVEEVPAARRTSSSAMVEQLTDRELAVLVYLPSRLSNAAIAGRLFVSVNTLKTHLKNIYRKLGVGDRGEAIDRAEELGLL